MRRGGPILTLAAIALAIGLPITLASAQSAEDWYKTVARGTATEVEAALTAGADPNEPDENGWQPLAIAAARNPDPGVIQALVRAGAQLEAVAASAPPYLPIHIAARSNPNPAVVRALVDAGADVDARTAYGATALRLAAEWNAHSLTNLPMHEVHLTSAVSLSDRLLVLTEPIPTEQPLSLPVRVSFHLQGFLMKATVPVVAIDETRSELALEYALSFQPDLTQVTVSAPTGQAEPRPATLATSYDFMEELLRLGADPNAMDNFGVTALMRAVRQTDGYRLTRLLLQYGANPLPTREFEFTALHTAVTSGEVDLRTIQLLIDLGLDVNARDSTGRTPILDAVQFGKPQTIELLLDAGANPRFPEGHVDRFGTDMMELARQNAYLYREGEAVHPVYWRLNDLQYD